MEGDDPFQLRRFVDAQQCTFEVALTEIRTGRKQSHWMWFIFPQLAGLGRSPNARYYGLRSLQEARAFLGHTLLGERYRESVRAILDWAGRKSAEEILGEVDAMKLKSSLTLFENASGEPLFADALDAFFGDADRTTLALLSRV